jgi:hypothetical protein
MTLPPIYIACGGLATVIIGGISAALGILGFVVRR